jgi:hypothetical protein
MCVDESLLLYKGRLSFKQYHGPWHILSWHRTIQ